MLSALLPVNSESEVGAIVTIAPAAPVPAAVATGDSGGGGGSTFFCGDRQPDLGNGAAPTVAAGVVLTEWDPDTNPVPSRGSAVAQQHERAHTGGEPRVCLMFDPSPGPDAVDAADTATPAPAPATLAAADADADTTDAEAAAPAAPAADAAAPTPVPKHQPEPKPEAFAATNTEVGTTIGTASEASPPLATAFGGPAAAVVSGAAAAVTVSAKPGKTLTVCNFLGFGLSLTGFPRKCSMRDVTNRVRMGHAHRCNNLLLIILYCDRISPLSGRSVRAERRGDTGRLVPGKGLGRGGRGGAAKAGRAQSGTRHWYRGFPAISPPHRFSFSHRFGSFEPY